MIILKRKYNLTSDDMNPILVNNGKSKHEMDLTILPHRGIKTRLQPADITYGQSRLLSANGKNIAGGKMG